jgi:hypothetical protein
LLLLFGQISVVQERLQVSDVYWQMNSQIPIENVQIFNTQSLQINLNIEEASRQLVSNFADCSEELWKAVAANNN